MILAWYKPCDNDVYKTHKSTSVCLGEWQPSGKSFRRRWHVNQFLKRLLLRGQPAAKTKKIDWGEGMVNKYKDKEGGENPASLGAPKSSVGWSLHMFVGSNENSSWIGKKTWWVNCSYILNAWRKDNANFSRQINNWLYHTHMYSMSQVNLLQAKKRNANTGQLPLVRHCCSVSHV